LDLVQSGAVSEEAGKGLDISRGRWRAAFAVPHDASRPHCPQGSIIMNWPTKYRRGKTFIAEPTTCLFAQER